MAYASKSPGMLNHKGVEQHNEANHLLLRFRKSDGDARKFLTLLAWDDLWIYDDELQRRAHARKVIERWQRVYS